MVTFNPKFYGTSREVQYLKAEPVVLYSVFAVKNKNLRHIFLLNKFVWFSAVLEILESLNIRRKLKALKIGVKIGMDH